MGGWLVCWFKTEIDFDSSFLQWWLKRTVSKVSIGVSPLAVPTVAAKPIGLEGRMMRYGDQNVFSISYNYGGCGKWGVPRTIPKTTLFLEGKPNQRTPGAHVWINVYAGFWMRCAGQHFTFFEYPSINHAAHSRNVIQNPSEVDSLLVGELEFFCTATCSTTY